MQRGGEGRDDFFGPGNLFSGFGGLGGFGSRRRMFSSIFGGRDPFDDPFFTRPFGSMFEPSSFGPGGSSTNMERLQSVSKGVLIEEINSDDEMDEEGKEVDGDEAKTNEPQKIPKSSTQPSVEHPDDDADDMKMNQGKYRNDYNRVERTKPQTQAFSFKKVTYGGVNGTYYTASTSRRAGGDGVVLEEHKQADSTTGQAAHRISRGINDKGHSVTRKLGSDGKVDTMQTLHNLEKDELAGFEDAWKGNMKKQIPGFNDESGIDGDAAFNNNRQSRRVASDGWALPSTKHFNKAVRSVSESGTNSSEGRAKKVVRINIE